jgi:hypothetical protein
MMKKKKKKKKKRRKIKEENEEGLVWFYLHYINICDYYREE